jgi:hypothetical protein
MDIDTTTINKGKEMNNKEIFIENKHVNKKFAQESPLQCCCSLPAISVWKVIALFIETVDFIKCF